MDLTLTRQSYNSWGIISELTSSDGNSIAICLEHAFPQEDGTFAPKVNTGSHPCILGTHQLDHGGPQSLYEITNVPGHKGILFHIGNYNKDSDGCILLGELLGNEMITGSKEAFDNFMKLQEGKSFNLTVY